ncbi:uncharacterized protein LOC123222707 [Mangifera indica]|uniref:uncharacterized protein LOC123222707 n=1 Tax=Mangifera indica TaxID=29780 RepID=UPI001CF93092|nr:uncharacterized protein LOC123222707 [Mangifera indica]XP_044501556.1 uncharacterized protein LOC123222707 [Mangifera indica]XP_044501557.1 uncharacterized protein LOC123222707 [Mangifera indica]XP_044501558.1 uncharacterized protein LOC123222707 [Mangifera indica]
MSAKTQLKTGLPQIFKSDTALKLAEQWVNNMTKVEEDEPTEVESEGRPSRLGLGAKVSRQSKFQPSNDPVERKLHARLDACKRKAAKNAEESPKDGHDDDDEDEDDLESRTSAFEKKRAVASTKKQK